MTNNLSGGSGFFFKEDTISFVLEEVALLLKGWFLTLFFFFLPSFPSILFFHLILMLIQAHLKFYHTLQRKERHLKHWVSFSKNLKMFNNPFGSIEPWRKQRRRQSDRRRGEWRGIFSSQNLVAMASCSYLTYLPKLPYHHWFKSRQRGLEEWRHLW